jgi:hypothetical protein
VREIGDFVLDEMAGVRDFGVWIASAEVMDFKALISRHLA